MFTAEEQKVIRLFAAVPGGIGRRIHSWIAELVPAIGLLSFGLWSGKQVYVVAGFLPLVFFASLRMFRQYKYSQLLQSICSKLLAAQAGENAAQQGVQGPTSPPSAGPRP